jgi:hypothetical protein
VNHRHAIDHGHAKHDEVSFRALGFERRLGAP